MIRFRADARLHDVIVTGCLRREPAIDFLSANEAKLEGVPDPEVLPSPQSGEQTHWALGSNDNGSISAIPGVGGARIAVLTHSENNRVAIRAHDRIAVPEKVRLYSP